MGGGGKRWNAFKSERLRTTSFGAKRCYTWGLAGVPRKSTYKWESREKKAGNNPISLHLKTYI